MPTLPVSCGLTYVKNDLGHANRNRVFTADPGHRGSHLGLELAVRRCNKDDTDESKQAAANKLVLAKWGSK